MRYALVIGNDRYTDPKLARLKTPSADSRALAGVLEDRNIGGFDEVISLINHTEAGTRRAISSFFSGKKPDDLLLVYFSGHGVLDDRGRLYLALKDTQTALLKATSIPSSFVADEMDSCRSKRQILILDCCHSGAFERGIKGDQKALTEMTFEGNGFGRVILTASDSTQYALEGDQVIARTDLSLFTHYLLEGLKKGEADLNNDGQITLEEWYEYTYTKVISDTPRQVPHKWSYRQQGDLIIANNPCFRKKPVEVPVVEPGVQAVPQPEALKPQPQKTLPQRLTLLSWVLLAFAGTVIAVMLALPRIEKMLASEPAPTVLPAVIPSLTLTSTAAPALTLTSTVVPLPIQINDARDVPMVLVPAGEFIMGATIEQKALDCQLRGGDCPADWYTNDVHNVFLDAYYIDVFEVTNDRYRDCVTANACKPPREISSASHEFYYASNSPYDNYPVVNVDWEMARIYCEWRGAQLPTDAQWEKAARGTDGRTYPWGEGLDKSYANYYLNIGDTSAVGSFEKDKSPNGVYDMFGNVQEWVGDWYLENYYQISPYANPGGPASGDNRTLRGSSWTYVVVQK